MKRLAIASLFALAACASPPVATAPPTSLTPAPVAASSDPLSQIAQFTLVDLANADAIAVANNDVVGHACFPALAQFINSLPHPPAGTTVSGAISAFETARALRLKVQGTVSAGLPDYLKLGCAALVVDEQTLLLKLGALAGGAAVLGPVAPALLGAP